MYVPVNLGLSLKKSLRGRPPVVIPKGWGQTPQPSDTRSWLSWHPHSDLLPLSPELPQPQIQAIPAFSCSGSKPQAHPRLFSLQLHGHATSKPWSAFNQHLDFTPSCHPTAPPLSSVHWRQMDTCECLLLISLTSPHLLSQSKSIRAQVCPGHSYPHLPGAPISLRGNGRVLTQTCSALQHVPPIWVSLTCYNHHCKNLNSF